MEAKITRANEIAKELHAWRAKFYVDGIHNMRESLNVEIDAAAQDEYWRQGYGHTDTQ